MTPNFRDFLTVLMMLAMVFAFAVLYGCATPPHHTATMVLQCDGDDCTIVDGKPKWAPDPDDLNACGPMGGTGDGGPRRCTEL